MRTRLTGSLLCLTALAVAPSCGGDTPTGSLIVPFVIGADVACTVLGVTEVTVELHSKPQDGSESDITASETVACEDGEAVFTNVAAGTYEVVAYGVDAESIVVVDNAGKPQYDTAEVTSGAENTADDVNLSTTPAKILVRWPINMGLKMCSDVALAEVVVGVYKSSGATELLTFAFPCDPEEPSDDQGYNLVVDDLRKIAGDELDTITLKPKNMAGEDIDPTPSEILKFEFTSPGHGRTVRLTAAVDCTGDTCDFACTNPDPDPMKVGNCLPD